MIRQILDRLSKNWTAKVTCIFLATMFFLMYKNISLGEKIFSVPLTIEADINLTPVNAYTKQVRVNVTCERQQGAVLKDDDFTAFLDLTPYKTAGTYTVPVKVHLSEEATKLNPIQIETDPKLVSVILEEKLFSSLSIGIEFSGQLPSGYEVKSYSVDPVAVRVSGPQSIIEKSTPIFPVTINLNGRQKSFTETTMIQSDQNQFVVEFPRSVLTNVTIGTKQGMKIIEANSIYYFGLPENLKVAELISPLFLELSGDEIFLESFNLSNYSVQADCSSITKAGISTVPILVNLPQQISLLNQQDLEVTLLIERQKKLKKNGTDDDDDSDLQEMKNDEEDFILIEDNLQ
ncbi:MAG: CdaR family protein [Treponemataceae bacterium]